MGHAWQSRHALYLTGRQRKGEKAMARKLYVGDAAIGRAIKSLGGVLNNVNDRVQDISVSIIKHAAGPGNGDMSRALDLCKTVARYKTLNVAYLVGFFAYFGNANVNLRANDGAGKVSLISKDSKRYRGFDPAGAEHNNWNEAFDNDGNRAKWYAGPEAPEFQPMTIGDLAARMLGFVKNTNKLISPENTKTVKGKEVPVFQLSEGDRQQVDYALAFIDKIAATLARHEDVQRKAAELAKAQAELEQDAPVMEAVENIVQPARKAA
jgi:hypothetical protein